MTEAILFFIAGAVAGWLVATIAYAVRVRRITAHYKRAIRHQARHRRQEDQ